MTKLKFIQGYPEDIISQIQRLIDTGELGNYILKKYPQAHTIRNDKQLYEYVMELKNPLLKKGSSIK